MRHLRTAAVAVALLLTGTLRAGFYDPQRPTSPLVTAAGVRPLPPDQFRDELDKLVLTADPNRPKGPRAAVVKQRDELLARGLGNFNPTELATLGEVQWRLRDSDAALATLKQAAVRDPRNFWALTHLGSVHQALGQLREALPNLESARDVFPDPWPVAPGLNPGARQTGDWFKQAERYQFKLLRLRLREGMGRPTGGRPVPATDVDALFDVKLVGPSGQYEAGKLADAEKAKLPPDAVAIVQQLSLWFPQDTRLLWLLGELYNAGGDLEAASRTLDMCVWSRRYESPALREHRRIVQEAFDAQTKSASTAPTAEPWLRMTWQVYTAIAVFGLMFLALVSWQVWEWLRRLRGPKTLAE